MAAIASSIAKVFARFARPWVAKGFVVAASDAEVQNPTSAATISATGASAASEAEPAGSLSLGDSGPEARVNSTWGGVPTAVYTATDASAAVSNTTAETAFGNSVTLAAALLRAGSRLRIRAQGIATATNGTDTLTIKVKIGNTVLVTTGAVDVADDDIFVIDCDLVVRTVGTGGTFVSNAMQILDAAGTALKAAFLASTAIDTTATQAVTVTATWSAASTANSCRMDMLTVELAA